MLLLEGGWTVSHVAMEWLHAYHNEQGEESVNIRYSQNVCQERLT